MQQNNINAEVRRKHDQRNLLHTVLLVTLAAVLMGVIAFSVFGYVGLIGASTFGAFALFGMGCMSPQMVLKLYKARPLAASEMPELHELLEELARRANLPSVPKLHYVPTKMLNAFAVGRKEDSAIAVTDGLIRAMTMRQLAGVLAHETAHIMNGDLKVMGMADVLNRITSFLSAVGLIGIPLIFGTGLDIPLLGPVLLLFAPTVGGMLQLALSRAREYDADLDGATLTGDPEGLASALKVLEEKQRGAWEGLVLPGSRLPQPSMLRTHPKTDERIDRLLAIRRQPNEHVVIRSETVPRSSITPPFRNPRIQWHRMGIYF